MARSKAVAKKASATKLLKTKGKEKEREKAVEAPVLVVHGESGAEDGDEGEDEDGWEDEDEEGNEEESDEEDEDDGVDEEGMQRLMRALGDEGLDEFDVAQLEGLGGESGGQDVMLDEEGSEENGSEANLLVRSEGRG